MIGKTVSHYKILEKLGEGGMGVVYKAEDLKLDRFVALKFLPREFETKEDAKKRFVVEAKSASSLDHPNICTIHEIDETPEGRTFIVMPCYEGETLREKLQRGALEMTDAIDIVHQVAAGLAKAHEKGIVHRDIKPGNILVTDDGQVKILDFGLAKLTGQSRITKTGATVGTVRYMSPEQATGKEVDARSDVFSLGVVLYEALTGHSPFKGEQDAAILYSIVNQDAPPISKYRKGTPGELEEIVERALEKGVEKRHQDAVELKDELEIFIADLALGKPMRPRRARWRKRALGRRAIAFAVVGIIVGAVAVRLLWQYRPIGPPEALALAVMDFRDLATPEDPTVSAGMTGLVHVGLVEASPVRVVSPEYLYDLRRRLFETSRGPIEETQALEVARQSGATMLLSGQMGRLGGVSYVTWRLVDVSTGRSVAARRVEGDNQALIADQVIAGVLPLLAEESGVEAPTAPPSVSELTTTSPEAYRHYVAGTLAREQNRDYDAFVELEEAVRLDSAFALAFFELSQTRHPEIEGEPARIYADRAWELRAHLGIKDRMRLEVWRHVVDRNDMDAIATSREMLARWPDDRQVLIDLCLTLYYNWYFDEAASVAGQGLALYPGDQILLNTYGNGLACTGRTRQALDVAHAYVRQYEDNPNAWDDLGLRYLEIGLPDSAEVAFRKALEVNPDFRGSQKGLAFCDYCRGNVEGAVKKLEEILESTDLSPSERVLLLTDMTFWPGLTLLYLEAGRYEKAMALFDEAWQEFPGPEVSWELVRRAQLYLRLGRTGEALRVARMFSEWAKSDYHRLSAKHLEARALVAIDSLGAARSAFTEFHALLKEARRSESYMAFRVAADIALAEGDPESALAALDEMQRHGVRPGGLADIERRESLAQAYRMAGRPKEAANVLEELLEVYGSHALAHFELGLIHEDRGRSADAAREYETFLEMWLRADEGLPQLEDARARLAKIRADS